MEKQQSALLQPRVKENEQSKGSKQKQGNRILLGVIPKEGRTLAIENKRKVRSDKGKTRNSTRKVR